VFPSVSADNLSAAFPVVQLEAGQFAALRPNLAIPNGLQRFGVFLGES
jgi:hypothetical protein